MERFSALFGPQVQFSYTALDRIVLNGYLVGLQQPGQLVRFFHEVVGEPCIEPKVLSARTERYRDWIKRYTEEQGIPLIEAPKGARKEDFVLPYYRRLGRKEGVACVLKSMEQNTTFVSYTRFPSEDPNYRRISRCRKAFQHFYFYVFDPVAGPMSLRFASYLPFNLTCYLNGHSFLAQALARRGVGFRKEDNAIVAVDDIDALGPAVAELTAASLRKRCEHWTRRLGPSWSVEEREAVGGAYRYSMAQIELATDVIFKRSAPLKAMFRRAAELGLLDGGADRTTHLFGRRIDRRYRGKLQTVLERRDAGHPVLRAYYQSSFVKQYEKDERLLRTETCMNNTYDVGVGRLLENLPTLVERMRVTNDRYLDAQAELLASTVDGGELARLAAPTLLGERRIPGIKLEDDRVIRLLDALLHPGGLIANWTTRDVQQRVCERARITPADYRLSQLRYDLGKLRAKGLVERIGKTRKYRLTTKGLRLGTLLVKLRRLLLGPLYTAALTSAGPRSANPDAVERAIRKVDLALDELCRTLGLTAA